MALGQVRAANTSELLRARWCEPALSVVDVRLASDGGDMDHYRFGPSRFSVVPHAVVGNVSVRFVPDQVRGRGRAVTAFEPPRRAAGRTHATTHAGC